MDKQDGSGQQSPDYIRTAKEFFPRDELELYDTTAQKVVDLLMARERKMLSYDGGRHLGVNPFDTAVVFKILGINPHAVNRATEQPHVNPHMSDKRVLIPTDSYGQPGNAMGLVLSYLGCDVIYAVDSETEGLDTEWLSRITQTPVGGISAHISELAWPLDEPRCDLAYVDTFELALTWDETRNHIPHEAVAIDRVARLLSTLEPGKGRLVVPSRITDAPTRALRTYAEGISPGESGWLLTEFPTYALGDGSLENPIQVLAPYDA